MRELDKPKKAKLSIVLVATAGLFIAFSIGAVTTYGVIKANDQRQQARYDLLARRVATNGSANSILNFSQLKTGISDYLATNQIQDNASVYFEYLPTGTSVGINEDTQLIGASLLKTPLAINLYKAAEQGKIDLDKKVSLQPEWLNDQYGDLYKKGAGYTLTLREATKIMLQDSDNTAALAIYSNLSEVMPLDKNLLSFIDIDYGVNKDETIKIGSGSYAGILKCLYFSCYLNTDNSQELLEYLHGSKDDTRIKLYLPSSVSIAHKIGTFDADNDGSHVQSDCGIIYVPGRNYLLCIMIKGDDPQTSREIGDISSIVYKHVTNVSNQ